MPPVSDKKLTEQAKKNQSCLVTEPLTIAKQQSAVDIFLVIGICHAQGKIPMQVVFLPMCMAYVRNGHCAYIANSHLEWELCACA